MTIEQLVEELNTRDVNIYRRSDIECIIIGIMFWTVAIMELIR